MTTSLLPSVEKGPWVTREITMEPTVERRNRLVKPLQLSCGERSQRSSISGLRQGLEGKYHGFETKRRLFPPENS